MAMPTTPQQAPHPAQPPPHAGMMGTAPKPAVVGPDTPGAEPVLLEDLDPIYLARLYPQAFASASSEARAMAMAAGQATWEAGKTAVAAAQVEGAQAYPQASPDAPHPMAPPPQPAPVPQR